jgi:hypothetical protein
VSDTSYFESKDGIDTAFLQVDADRVVRLVRPDDDRPVTADYSQPAGWPLSPVEDPAVLEAILAERPVGSEPRCVAWTCSPCYPAPELRAHLFLVTGDGHTREVPYRAGPGYSGSWGRGGSSPTLSPDARWVAYAYRDTLYSLGVSTLETVVMDIAPVRHLIHIAGWDPTGAGLLYHVSYSPMYPPDNRTSEWRIVEPTSGRVRAAVLPDSILVHGWLPAGDLLVTTWTSATYGIWDLDTGRQTSTRVPRELRQIQILDDGESVLGGIDSSLVRMSLNGEDTTVLVTGRYAEYQQPRMAPDGEHVACVRYERVPIEGTHGFTVYGRLVVDGREFDLGQSLHRYEWLSGTRVVATMPGRIVILEPESGAIVHDLRP